jgi:hypothetical protein
MGTVKQSEIRPTLSPKDDQISAHTENVMVVVDFNDGPAPEPDPPHSHLMSKCLTLLRRNQSDPGHGKDTLIRGRPVPVPANVPHTVQTLSKHVRLIDAFNPIRNDF